MWDIEVTWVHDWLQSLDQESYRQVWVALDVLSAEGPSLGRPLVDSLVGSRIHNLTELRPTSPGNSEVRILFAFDPKRRAILLLGGDKRGAWGSWYREAIPIAERRYLHHLRLLDEGRE